MEKNIRYDYLKLFRSGEHGFMRLNWDEVRKEARKIYDDNVKESLAHGVDPAVPSNLLNYIEFEDDLDICVGISGDFDEAVYFLTIRDELDEYDLDAVFDGEDLLDLFHNRISIIENKCRELMDRIYGADHIPIRTDWRGQLVVQVGPPLEG